MADDRNKVVRDAFAQGQQQREIAKRIQAAFAAFAGDFATGKVNVLDRFAVKIKKGDLVLWTPPHQLVYEVVDVQPILQPIANQPIGQIQVVLELTAPVMFMAEQPAMGMIVVGHQVDKDHAELTTPTGATKDNVPPAGQTLDFMDHVAERAARDPEFAKALDDERAKEPPDGDTGN